MNPRGNERNLRSPENHEDRIAGGGFSSMSPYNLVHTFIPMPQAMKSRMQGRQWKKNGKSSRHFQQRIWRKTRAKKEAILEAQRGKKKFHFATLMDTCHLKNSELEPKITEV